MLDKPFFLCYYIFIMIDRFVGDTTASKLKKGLFLTFNRLHRLGGKKGPSLI